MLTILNMQNSIFNQFIAELRDKEVHTDSMRFRKNIERIGQIFAYEISKTMDYVPHDIHTPLGTAAVNLIKNPPVIATILRAGLPLHYGMLSYFDKAESAFITAYRKEKPDGSFNVQVDYVACPNLNGKTLILCDPMLATGRSMCQVYEQLIQRGTPAQTHIISVIASEQAVNYVRSNVKGSVKLWVGSVDEKINSKSYIIPGLGDAGDLAFGEKLDC